MLRGLKWTLDEDARGQAPPPPGGLQPVPMQPPRRVLVERQFQRDLAAMPDETGQRGRRDHDRQAEALAEQLGLVAARRHVPRASE